MSNKKKLLAISGSTREKSSNLLIIQAIAKLMPEDAELEQSNGIDTLPHFNPDIDYDNPPQAVTDFRDQIQLADAILICTPEYAMGAPGSLKNALDWLVSSSSFSKKPVALITASLSGHKAHASLLETLKMIDSDIDESTSLLISFIKTKVNEQAVITDAEALAAVKSVLAQLFTKIK
ncbi:MAG: NAD(P)H-dependent oxidoreductase [Gemmatimonadaceae bacterium]|nr:NAD(P)H-dependent oxidoreductase [Chitinophagaceae bacterium]